MARTIPFAINRISAPRIKLERFFEVASGLGVDAVEFRNDLEGVEIQDGTPASRLGALAREHNLRILSLNALYPFDLWNDERADQAKAMAQYARECGAAAVVMCPFKETPRTRSDSERHADLIRALKGMGTILRDNGLVGHVEPLGFSDCALRYKRLALDAIAEVNGEDVFDVLHDTFHHHVASDPDYFPERTGLVQISGVEDPAIPVGDMQDGHRVLVGEADRLGNVEQMRALLDGGYKGYFSFEPFAESVMNLDDPESALRASMDYIEAALGASRG